MEFILKCPFAKLVGTLISNFNPTFADKRFKVSPNLAQLSRRFLTFSLPCSHIKPCFLDIIDCFLIFPFGSKDRSVPNVYILFSFRDIKRMINLETK